MINYAIVFLFGVVIGFLFGNKKYRRIVGALISRLGNWMQHTSQLDHEDRGGWVMNLKGEPNEKTTSPESARKDQQ